MQPIKNGYDYYPAHLKEHGRKFDTKKTSVFYVHNAMVRHYLHYSNIVNNKNRKNYQGTTMPLF